MRGYVLVLRSFEARVFVEGPVVFGSGVIDGGLEDGFGLDTREQFGRAGHCNLIKILQII